MSYVWLTWLADALRAEGCTVVEEGDWKHRGRPSSTGSFNPYGVLQHHTGATASTSNPFPSKSTLINGRSDLPGPLCHVGVGYDGVCHVIAAGRANHGGESRGSGPIPAGDANALLVGVEIDYNGTQPISAAQKDAATRVAAACLKRFKRSSEYVRIHAETSTTGKWDTGGVSGSTWRSLVATQIETGGDDMPLSTDDLENVARYVWTSPYGGTAGNPSYWNKLTGTDSPLAIETAEQVWNRYAVHAEDGSTEDTYGQSLTYDYQAAKRILAGTAGGGGTSADGAHTHHAAPSSSLRSAFADWPLLLLLLVIAALLIVVIVRQ